MSCSVFPPGPARGWLAWRRHDVALALTGDRLWLARPGDSEPAAMPAYVAVATADGRVVAMGDEARALSGRAPGNIAVVRLADPAAMRDDPELLIAALRRLLRDHGGRGLLPPRIVFVAEANVRREVRAAALQAGAREVMLLEPPMAAAIGAGLAVEEPVPREVLVLDRHTCSFAVVADAGVIAGFAEAQGVGRLWEDMARHARTTIRRTMEVEELDAARRREGLAGTAATGGEVAVTLFADSVVRRLARPFQQWLAWQYQRSLASVPAGKRREAAAAPVLLVGPYAGDAGLRELVASALNRPVTVPAHAATCVIRGARSVLADLDFLVDFAARARRRS